MYLGLSNYRNRYPIDHRYEYYPWPSVIVAECSRCRAKFEFMTVANPGYPGIVYRQSVPKEILGRGSCTQCSNVSSSLRWPDQAFYKKAIRGGTVWAWNEDYLEILRLRASSSSHSDLSYLKIVPGALFYLARLPKFVVSKANRSSIINWIEKMREKA